MLATFISAVSWLLAMFFAAMWGAHLYETIVIFPGQASALPKSLIDWLATPYAMRVMGFFLGVVPGFYTVSTIAVVLAIVTYSSARLALLVAGICGLIHMAMVLLIFRPTNVQLGLNPGGPGASNLAPQEVQKLMRRWGRWNLLRLSFETAGLIASLFAFKAS
jgi:hypothetical protein